MSRTGGPGSYWWPVPVGPSSWFSADELARSRSYHRPLARVGLAKLGGRVLLLAVAQVVLARLGWASLGLAAVVAVTLAWWLPATLSDLWFEYRHEPRFGSSAMPATRFASGSVLVLVVSAAGIGLGAVWLALAWHASSQWWWLLLGLVVPVVIGVVGWLEPRFTNLAHKTSPLEVASFGDLAEAAGVAPVEFHRMESDALGGLNALTATGRRRPRIVVTTELLEAPNALTAHVVAHELAHLRHRHPARTRVLATLVWIAVVVGAATLSRLASTASAADTDQPPALAIVALFMLLAGSVGDVPLAFVSRAQERQADASAFTIAGPVSVPLLRRLHVTDRAMLDPGMIERLLLPHPSPAERLQRASAVATTGLPSKV